MTKRSLYRDVESSDLHDLRLHHLGLSWSALDRLQKAGFDTVGQVAELTVEEIARISGLTLDMHLEISDRFFSPIFEGLGESDYPLSRIELAAPLESALTQSGIKTMGALGSMSYVEILALPGIDISGVAQIKRRLERLGPSEEPSSAPTRLRSTSAPPKEGSQAPAKEQRPTAENERTSASLTSSESRACKSTLDGHSKTDSSPTSTETIDSPVPLLETLNLSTRAHNALRRAGHNTIADIASLTDEALLDIRQVGVNTLEEIRSELKAYLNSYHKPVSSPLADLNPSPIGTLGLSEKPGKWLTEEGFVTVGWLVHELRNQNLDENDVGSDTMTEIAQGLREFLDDLGIADRAAISFMEDRLTSLDSDANSSTVNEMLLSGPPIEHLSLSTRVYNALRRAGIDTINQLARMSDNEVHDVRNLGTKAASEIEQALANYIDAHAQTQFVAPSRNSEEAETTILDTPGGRTSILGILIPQAEAPSPPTRIPIVDELIERTAPVPLESISVTRLGLSRHRLDQLSSQGIHSISDLARALSGADHQREPVTARLIRYLKWIVEQDEKTWHQEVIESSISPISHLLLSETTLAAQIQAWLEVLTSREQRILKGRFGCDGPKMTLAEIGEELDLSRERIRQLEQRALNKLSRYQARQGLEGLKQYLVKAVEHAGGLMAVDEVRANLLALVDKGPVDETWATTLLLEAIDELECATKDGVWGLADLPLELVPQIRAALSEMLQRDGGPVTRERLLVHMADTSVLPQDGTQPSDAFVRACTRTHPDVEIVDGGCVPRATAREPLRPDAVSHPRSKTRESPPKPRPAVIASPKPKDRLTIKLTDALVTDRPPRTLEEWETHLRSQVGQIELLGEIALTDQQRAQLGRLIASQVAALGHGRAIRSLRSQYPCALAVYLVTQGVYGYEGGDYWTEVVAVTGLSRPRVSDVGRAFEDILEALGLPLFYDMRAEAHRYVSLILAHGGIPNYCLPDFFAHMLQPSILRAKYADMSAAELIDEWRWRSSIRQFTDKPIIRFLIYGGRVSEDFVRRCREMAWTYVDMGLMPDPKEVGLPKRVIEAYDVWIAEQDAEQVKREQTDRWRLRKPQALVDPWGEGFLIDLPPQQAPATEIYADVAWQVTAGDETHQIPVRVRRVGFDRKTEAEVFTLSRPVKRVDVSLQVDGKTKRTWHYPGIDEAHPMLVFDPQRGALLSWSLSLPAASLGFFYPTGTMVEFEGDAHLIEELPRLPWGWADFQGQVWDLKDADHLTLVEDGKEIVSVSLQPDEAGRRPFPAGGETLTPISTEGRAPIYVGPPPCIRIPFSGRALQELELQRWRLTIHNKWSARPEIHQTTTLEELKSDLLVSDEHVDLPLRLSTLLGPSPCGNFSVQLRGPLGRDAGFTLRLVPHLTIYGHERLYLPDPKDGAPPVTLRVETAPRCRIECRAEDNAQSVRVVKRAENAWQHEIDVEPAATEIDLAVIHPNPCGEAVRVPVHLPIRRLRWALVDEETATRRGIWTGDPVKRPIDALLQLESPFLLVTLPLPEKRGLQMRLRLLDVEGEELQAMGWDLLSHNRELWRFDLSAFLDTIRTSRSPILRFELAIWGLPDREGPLRLPVLSLTQTLLVEDAQLSVGTRGERVFFDLTWREPVYLRNRRVRFWPLWRPWEPFFERSIPDDAEGATSFRVQPEKAESGKYRLEFMVVDPWAPAGDTPHCPPASAPSTADVELIRPERQLEALRNHLDGRGPKLEVFLERAAIRQDIGELDGAESDRQWCYEHLDDCTIPQMLALLDLTRAAGDEALTRSLQLKLFAARRVKRLLAARRSDSLSTGDFETYLANLPRSGLLPESTCQLLLSVENENVRLRSVQQLIRRENRLGPKTVVDWVADAAISDSDAVALLALNAEFSAETLKADLKNPIVSRLLESLAPQLGDKTPLVQPGTWVRTEAGWGRIDRIEDQEGKSVAQFLSGRTDYRLHVTLRPLVDAEPIIVDLPRRLIIFTEAEVIYTCGKCGGFSAWDWNLVVEQHDYAAHSGIGPSYRKERITRRSLRNLTYRAQPPVNRGLGL